MKLPLYSLLCAAIIMALLSFTRSERSLVTDKYIERFKDLAVEEMHRSGIPASVTLAQAIVESNSGMSPLAMHANNHFGIKCKSEWIGSTYYLEDDDRNSSGKLIKSCFRAYDNAVQSFKDRTNFLMERPRYALLFSYSSVDYREWATGLSACGYATDPNYSRKIISIIERYELHHFDKAIGVEEKTDNSRVEVTRDTIPDAVPIPENYKRKTLLEKKLPKGVQI